MKKIISIISALALCATLTACNKTENDTANETANDFSGIKLVRWGYTDREVFDTLEELEWVSDIAVVGTFIEDSVQDLHYHYSEVYGKDIIGLVTSDNKIKITRVLKGDVEVGDCVKIRQGYAIDEGMLITRSDLTPMIKGDSWIFFLNYTEGDDDGVYWCTGDSDGRYPVSTVQNQTLAISEYSELGVYDRKDFKDEIYNEIIEKYGI